MLGKGSTHLLVDEIESGARIPSWKIDFDTNLKSDDKIYNWISKIHNKSPKYNYLNFDFLDLCLFLNYFFWQR